MLLWKVCFSEDDDGLVICSSNSSELFLQFDAGAGILLICLLAWKQSLVRIGKQ